MDTEHLATFVRIVREGSFSRAARTLDLAQPTISARIQALEQAVGGPLFTRGGRKVALTPRGETFLPYAQRALAVLAEGSEAARLIELGQRGRVSVGTIPSLEGGFVARAIARFHGSHPRVELFVRSGHSDQVAEMLDDGVVQLGLLRRPPFNVAVAPLLRFREPLVLAVSPRHPLAGGGEATTDELSRRGGPLLLVRWGGAPRGTLARLAAEHGTVLELPIDTVRHLLGQGVGMAFLTQTLVADDLAAGRLSAVTVAGLPPLFSDSMLVCRAATTTLAAAVADFVAAVRREAGDLLVPETQPDES